MAWAQRMTWAKWIAAMLAVLVAQAVILKAMGRLTICKCGYVKVWHGVVVSSENSQHIADWYTFTHVTHGFVFYLLLFVVLRRAPIAMRFFLAFVIEGVWEVIENSSFIIDRYRTVTISRDYYGDTIVNSIADTLAMAAGFLLAWRLPVAVSVLLVLATELLLAWGIKDNLILNIIMLLYPLEAIKRWQAGSV
jgi:hypothetical protein